MDSSRGPKNDWLEGKLNGHHFYSELIVLGSQFLMLLTVFLVWKFSPKPIDEMEISYIPYIFYGYTTLILIRLGVLKTFGINNFISSVSILFDFLILTAMIYSFSLQYQQGPGFSLRVTTFSFYFILLVINCFRFNERLILWAGAVAASCWSGLVIFNLKEGVEVTNSFVEYTLSHKVLIGAEIEKVLSLIVFSIILYFVISRTRKLLEKSVRNAFEKERLQKFFSPQVREVIGSSFENIRPGIGQVKNCAVMFVDLRNFSEFSKNSDMNSLSLFLSFYQDTVVQICLKYNGIVDKFQGDGALVYFPENQVACRKRAINCAREIINTLDLWFQEHGYLTKANIALSYGEIFFGVIGSKERLDYTILGEEVNIVAKLEKVMKSWQEPILATSHFNDVVESNKISIRKNVKLESINDPKDLISVSL